MRLRTHRYLVALFAAVGVGALTLALSPSATARQDDVKTTDFTMDDLAFFAGHWEGELFGGRSEEAWLAPDAGTMLGSFRLKYGEQTRVMEFLMITQRPEGIKYFFSHYNHDYSTWEKNGPLDFDLIETGPSHAVFESSVQNNPKRLTYRVRDDGMLSVLVEGEEDGKTESFDAVFSRVVD